jgi:hypothetical protein
VSRITANHLKGRPHVRRQVPGVAIWSMRPAKICWHAPAGANEGQSRGISDVRRRRWRAVYELDQPSSEIMEAVWPSVVITDDFADALRE